MDPGVHSSREGWGRDEASDPHPRSQASEIPSSCQDTDRAPGHQSWHQCQTWVPVLGQLQDRGGAEETPRAPGEEGLSLWATDRRC